MSQAEASVPKRHRRVDQKLRDLAKRATEAKGLADRISGTSEETASLFSSGTTPFPKLTIYSREYPAG
jgi:hypothetical protein